MPSNKKLLQAAAGSAGGGPPYVEDVFSTFLFTGNGSDQSIDNGIDIAGKGGLVWTKSRSTASSNELFDTERGVNEVLYSDGTNDSDTLSNSLKAFNSNGFTMGNNLAANVSSRTGVSWSFRKAEKFFDVQTWTGNSTAGRTIAHNLGSVPAVIITKRYDASGAWWTVYHKNSPNSVGWLNETNAFDGNNMQDYYGNGSSAVTPTSSVFTVSDSANVNGSGATYIAYLFASDAGGFGEDEDENIIKCGSYTTDSSGNATVNLGFEPQWILSKRTNATGAWYIRDVMRGMPVGGNNALLFPNTSGAEGSSSFALRPSSTGFTAFNDAAAQTNVYIAIRRPMKTPEAGTEVFAIDTYDSTPLPSFESPFVADMAFYKNSTSVQDWKAVTRLLGSTRLVPNATTAETAEGDVTWDYMNGWYSNSGTYTNVYSWMFKRATGFMDVVVADAPGYAWTNQPHNLGVVPELLIVKSRAVGGTWYVTSSALASSNYYMGLNSNSAAALSGVSMYSATATTVSYPSTSTAGSLLSYLFATLAGISKVGNYTGTGADLNVDCGFTGGARFILIKRTDSTGDWYYWDSVRGISAGNDPYLLLNSTAAQVTNTDYIDPLASGFTVTSSAPAGLNSNGGTYIFLAIA